MSLARIAMVAALVVGCAASDSEVRTAKTATYAADPHQILQIAAQATAEIYKLGDLDEAKLAFSTVPRFYSKTGDLESPGAGDVVQIRPGSVMVTLIVHVVPTADGRVAVTVTPKTFQAVAGSPKPRELAPDDPYLPSFVLGRADALALAIYNRAKPYVVAPPTAK